MNPDHLAASRDEIAAIFGRPVSQIRKWEAAGMPPQGTEGFNVAAIVEWRETRWERRLSQSGQDPELIDGGEDSPALEEYRRWRAKLAELEFRRQEGRLVELDVLNPMLSKSAALFRRACETLERRFGTEAADILREAIDDSCRLMGVEEEQGEQ
ncbi:hypothetical protein [Planctomicrobium sp. SH664]|uniref:hypothetical protein n=1 Tax=Planctomicrobium sp. SH664 TaxID=3448125 RepID=UPI003F5B088C